MASNAHQLDIDPAMPLLWALSAGPTGVGEPATLVFAPAVANALSAATGQRFSRLPLQLSA